MLLVAVAVLAIAACGGSGSSSSSSSGASSSGAASTSPSGGKSGGTINFVEGTAPQSLDPGFDYTTQGAEVNWIVYTGLTTYAHANGVAGTKLIPGLAASLPTITDGGKTYTATLRKGLVFSNGKPVVASDFAYAVERAIKIPWGGSGQFITPVIAGGTAFSTGKAKTISGITTDDATGKIVIHLTAPYGAFDNVLAEPAMAIVPTGVPFQNQPNNPPPGVGPYMVKNIVPNTSFSVVKNPHWASMNIPGIPSGHVDQINVKISSNVSSNAESVLSNSADVFDWADTIPGSLLGQIQSQASSRYRLVNLGGSTYYIFLNSQHKPFNNQLAREAVVTGLNQDAMSRLGSGTLVPACFFLPPSVPGHPTASCPYGTPGLGNLAKAKALVKQSGMAGQPVTVWSQERSPRQQWMTYYTQFLNQIGFKATQKLISDPTYFTTIGELKLHPQTGFLDWNQDFPNPIDFYGVLLDGHAILPTNNENVGEVNDPYVNSQVSSLGKIPTPQLQTNSTSWQKVDEYVAKKAYVAVFGYEKFPEFTSNRINFGSLVFHSVYGWDFTSFELK
ncbi:MAG TPA: ABC transporter substrate-binding protein [Solirubrobacteraceae bacterium]|jgi:peptide/nickel transport system substrate-binding protein|nr:ABC transporter substrate-binding protein [Solirubrobacteraceae bacterium]